jgi:Arc/MetJ-type ribon-helix-helix transcriptional regulator
MALSLDPATEQRIQRQAELGPYTDSDELVNRALDLLESQESWIARNRDAIRERLEESFAQAERGELYTPEEARELLDEDRRKRADSADSVFVRGK